jgi:WD40 repeat protein
MDDRRPSDATLTAVSETLAPDATGPGATPLGRSGRYEVVGTVGRGGLGLILRAIDHTLGRPIALKVMRPEGGMSRARFDGEARITARLEHPSIVPIYDAGEFANDVPYYAMKLSGGRTLAAAIRDAPYLPARLGLLGAVIAVADAIAFAHSKHVIHRDLTPGNVLVGEFGETLVIDWGLAKDLGEPDAAPDPQAPTDRAEHTRAGAVMGTPAFMAPEQARGEPLDFRADVFAIGTILYMVLSGQAPRHGTSAEMLASARTTPIPAVDQLVPDVPRDLAAICARALSLDREARYPTARELAEDLRRFQTGQLVAARDYSAAQRLGRWIRQHRSLVAVAAISTAVLAVVGTTSIVGIIEAQRRAEASAAEAEVARVSAEAQAARLLLAQARSAVERDPATALAWLKRLLASPAVSAIDLEEVRVLVADARARGITSRALEGAADVVDLQGTADGVAVSRSGSGALGIWDIGAGQRRASLVGPFRDVALAPDGHTLATVDDHGASVRDLDGREQRRLRTSGPIVSVGFVADGTPIVIDGDGAVQLETGARLALDVPITVARGLPDGRVAFAGPHVVGWWAPRGGAMARAPFDGQPVRVATSADGARIAVISAARSAVFAVTADAIRNIDNGEMGDVAFGPDDQLAWTSRTGISIRAARTGHAIALASPQNAMVAFAGARLIAINDQNRLFVFDELPVQPSRRWARPVAVRYVKPTADERVVYLTIGGEIGIADPGTGLLRSIATDQRFYAGTTVALAVAGDVIAVGSTSLWKVDATSGAVALVWDAPAACIARLPSGDVAAITESGELRVYDPSLITLRVARQVPAPVRECIARPDGTLAISHQAGLISIVDVATGGELARDAGVRISTAAGACVQIFRGHGDEVSHLTFSPSGTAVTSSSMDGTILRWPIDPRRAPPTTAPELARHVASLTSIVVGDSP